MLTPTRTAPGCRRDWVYLGDRDEEKSLIWWRYRASVRLKPYPTKQCSSAHNHHQSCHCITFAKPPMSCLLYFLTHSYYTFFNLENFYLLVYSTVQYPTWHIIVHFRDDLPSQLTDWWKNTVCPTNHLAGTSKPNLTATKWQHKNLNGYKEILT